MAQGLLERKTSRNNNANATYGGRNQRVEGDNDKNVPRCERNNRQNEWKPSTSNLNITHISKWHCPQDVGLKGCYCIVNYYQVNFDSVGWRECSLCYRIIQQAKTSVLQWSGEHWFKLLSEFVDGLCKLWQKATLMFSANLSLLISQLIWLNIPAQCINDMSRIFSLVIPT